MENTQENNRCIMYREGKGIFGEPFYYQCEHDAKYETSCKNNKGEFETRLVCKTHLNSIKRTSDRIMKKTGYDMQLTFKELSTQQN